MNKKGGIIIGSITIVVILLVIAAKIVPIILSYSSVDIITITIKNKERISTSDDSYYLIFTEDEVFKNEDSTLHWKFDSSDVYNQLDIGETYKVKVNWYRIKVLSEYRNIISIEDGGNN